MRLPAIADVQIAAFAHECTWHRDADAFRSAQATEDMPFAEEAFAYLDVFAEGPHRSATAIFSGRVRDTALRVNELTGFGFRWAAVRTLIGDIDLVADPAVVDGEPTAGGVVIGSFWLSGRISTVHVEAEVKAQGANRLRRRLWPRVQRSPRHKLVNRCGVGNSLWPTAQETAHATIHSRASRSREGLLDCRSPRSVDIRPPIDHRERLVRMRTALNTDQPGSCMASGPSRRCPPARCSRGNDDPASRGAWHAPSKPLVLAGPDDYTSNEIKQEVPELQAA